METHPLTLALESWPGRKPSQLAFEARGFAIHKAWQERIIRFCGEQQERLLNRYWDEVALETMQSLGQGGAPDQRAFGIQPKYRSKFLDELHAARDFLEPDYPSPPLIKCLFEREKRILLNTEFREAEKAFFEDLQREEERRMDIQATGWTGAKRDVIPFVEKFCEALNFERHRNRWRRSTSNDLAFEVGVDLGGNPYCITPPLKFRIFHRAAPKYVFEINSASKFHRLVPGFIVYGRCRDAEDYVLGIKAYIELFKILACSFEG